MSGNEIETALRDVRAETLTVAWQFAAQVDLVIEASPWHHWTRETSEGVERDRSISRKLRETSGHGVGHRAVLRA